MLSAEMDRFDGEKMALLWVKHIDGVLVFPKLPAQLREYHKSWETNECIKAAMERTENDNAILQRYLDRMVPGDFIAGGSEFEEQEENSGQSVTQITTNQNEQTHVRQSRHNENLMVSYPQEHAHVGGGEVQYPLHRYSHPLNLPNGTSRALSDDMRRDTLAGNVVVNGYAIGAGHGLPTFQQYGSERRKRRCKLCQQSPNPERTEFALQCAGRGGARFCNWRHDT
jgi:hypothetical protein